MEGVRRGVEDEVVDRGGRRGRGWERGARGDGGVQAGAGGGGAGGAEERALERAELVV